ncbi:hypothetical protein B0H34DRAFT_856722 [Crassisporium funariophilum]|nr:hypothetical protein B0H34DRAFT_856722 [Crassisporium funariophilum]
MSTTRLHPHHSLPAPVVHATFSVSQSKSHVLAGVQDAYWSDDEAEDAECPLCLEEMDISDLNFKPCICGYQICRFCWHHIKENLNKRCPACRRVYTDDAVEFKPIATQDHKRLTQQKKQRDRERKELDALGRRPLANVRVVQRNVVYVVGIGPRFAKEELIPTLRSNEYFGQYGKITKILLVKRNSPGGGPVVGLYITYHRREDAARAIAAVDGTSSPGGGRDVMRASHGTTKYCMAFLRGVSCNDHSCMHLHEWGDEKDCFTKEDLTTLKHTMKATESRTRALITKKGDEDAGLPRAAAWAQKGLHTPASAIPSSNSMTNLTLGTVSSRQPRRANTSRQARNLASASPVAAQESRPSHTKGHTERKPVVASSSRPSTPAVIDPNPTENPTDIHPELKTIRQKETTTVRPSTSPAPSTTTVSDVGSGLQEPISSIPSVVDSAHTIDISLRASTNPINALLVPPGLSAPPGISSPSRPPRAETASPQTPLLASQSSYQMSNAARALLDDVKARRESTLPVSSGLSPFPDFDRTLQTLSGEGGGGFSFNLDPKLADQADATEPLPDFDVTSNIPFHGSYIDAFPALRSGSPYSSSPPAGYSPNLNRPIYDPALSRTASGHLVEKQSTRGSGYLGSFNPFSDPAAENATSSSPLSRSRYSPVDEERKVSRFGFAQGRRSSTAASSPLHSLTPLNHDQQPFFHAPEEIPHHLLHPWPPGLQSYNHLPVSLSGSPQIQHSQVQPVFLQPQNRPLPHGGELSEAQLRSFIQSSQERGHSAEISRNHSHSQQPPFRTPQRFEDPAIMSASFGAPTPEYVLASVAYGPPPGIPTPQGVSSSPAMTHLHQSHTNGDGRNNSAHGESFLFYSQGREVSVPSAVLSQCGISTIANDPASSLALPSSVFENSQQPSPRFKSSPQFFLNPPSPWCGVDVNCNADHHLPSVCLLGLVPSTVVPTSSATLSAEDFPALLPTSSEPTYAVANGENSVTQNAGPVTDNKSQAKAERKAAKKAAAVGKALERQKLAQEKADTRAAEKAKVAKEKAAEKEKSASLKLQQTSNHKESVALLELQGASSKSTLESLARSEEVKAAPPELQVDKPITVKKIQKITESVVQSRRLEQTIPTTKASTRTNPNGKVPVLSAPISEATAQVPLLSKKPRKNKPISKAVKIPKDDEVHEELALPSATEAPRVPWLTTGASSNNTRSQSLDRYQPPTSVEDLLEEIDVVHSRMDLANNPFFDIQRLSSPANMPLEYGPLVHALSALSVGGGSFANNMPSGSIDNAVSSFQQLLETLTQTISDLLRLLPRTTWDDSSSFDGVLRDMLKGDDFLDDGGEEGPSKEDEVAALTLALERRARWMEVQLSKLEELHRDINTAAVRAVLSFNDSGWDRHVFLPRIGNTLRRFDNIGIIEHRGISRPMTADELEKKLAVAKEAAVFAEADIREAMQRFQKVKLADHAL